MFITNVCVSISYSMIKINTIYYMAAIVRALRLVNLWSVIPPVTPMGITEFSRQNFCFIKLSELRKKEQELNKQEKRH